MSNLKLSPPWALHYRKIVALFGKDPEIKIEYDEDTPEVKLYVSNQEKAEAITQILPSEVPFGNVVFKVSVIPENVNSVGVSVFQKAFNGNPILKDIQTIDGIFSNPVSYVVFEKGVVQFYSDNLADLNGITSTLYENIARDVFGTPSGVYFCTEMTEKE